MQQMLDNSRQLEIGKFGFQLPVNHG